MDEKIKGRIKEAAVAITGDEDMKAEGRAEQRKAEEDFEALLGAVRIVAVTEAIARRAVDLRTRYRLATPDAVQLGTALEAGCQAFLTSDAGDFLRVAGEIRVIVPAKLTDG